MYNPIEFTFYLLPFYLFRGYATTTSDYHRGALSLGDEHRQTIRGDDEYTACMSSICVYAKYGNMSHKQKKTLFYIFWHEICIVILVLGKFYRQI